MLSSKPSILSANKINRLNTMKDWVGLRFSDLAMCRALGAKGMLQDWSRHSILPVSESDPARASGACCSHRDVQRLIKMIDVCGEEHRLLNIGMADRRKMNLMSCYSVTFFNLRKHFACTMIEAM